MSEYHSGVVDSTLFAFAFQDFLRALDTWKAEQLSAYPHQSERIETTARAMLDLMHSRHVVEAKLVVRQTLHPEGGA